MSEGFIIRRTEDGEISAAFSPTKSSFLDIAETNNEGNGTSVDEEGDQSNVFSTEQQGNNLTEEDDLKNVSSIQNDAQDNQDISTQDLNSGFENDDFGEPPSASTPVMRKGSPVVSTCVSDKAPLLKERSSTSDSCLGTDMEGDNGSFVPCECGYQNSRECPEHGSLNNVWIIPQAQKRESLMVPGTIRVPIVGHETMEARSKFTVFKIHVMVEDDEAGWFIFRRYSDFVNLNDQLKLLFPNFRLALPPKRWFRSNFDPDFLEERQIGLQAFLDNITGHRDICVSKPVSDFFCFDDPPGPHDTLEESRAYCEYMEESVYLLKKELSEKDSELELLKEEMDLYKNQVQLLTNRLSELNRFSSLERSNSEKRRSFGNKYDVDALFGSGDILLTGQLEPVAEPKSQEAETEDQVTEEGT